MEYVSKSIADTASLARTLLANLVPGRRATVLALYGDLGSGKTTFVQELGKLLGIAQTIQSPTFVIMRRYAIHDPRFKNLVHVDAYRLESPDELSKLGWNELLANPESLIAIEWAERVEPLLPEGTRRIRFTFVDEATRVITAV